MVGLVFDAIERHGKHQKLAQDGDALIKRITEIDTALQELPRCKSSLPGVGEDEQKMILTHRLEQERTALCERFHSIFLPKPQAKPDLKVFKPGEEGND
jgi:hypothetical protein